MDLSLGVFTFIFIFMLLWVIEEEVMLVIEGNNIFASSLLDATIQDGSIRERSNDIIFFV